MPALKRSASQMVPGGSTAFYMRKKKKIEKSDNLGRITGRVAPSLTTLAKAPGPFTGKKYITFLYENALQQIAGAANVMTAITKPNDMYDFDGSGDAGNKQPLYYDTLLSASGPYKNYKVISWKTTYTFISTATCPVDIFISPPVGSSGEFDSLAEADNFPGVKRLRLTPVYGSQTKGTVTVYGHIKDLFPASGDDASFVGGYNSSPALIAYQVILVRGSDGTTAPSVYWSVKHEAYTELTYIDALVS